MRLVRGGVVVGVVVVVVVVDVDVVAVVGILAVVKGEPQKMNYYPLPWW